MQNDALQIIDAERCYRTLKMNDGLENRGSTRSIKRRYYSGSTSELRWDTGTEV